MSDTRKAPHTLMCNEVWGGNRKVVRTVQLMLRVYEGETAFVTNGVGRLRDAIHVHCRSMPMTTLRIW
jgi:hypothetical protein